MQATKPLHSLVHGGRRAATCLGLVLLVAIQGRGARAEGDAAAPSSSTTPSVTISDAWARATPTGAKMGAIYMTLESATGDRLMRASLPRSVCAETQIHEIVVAPGADGAEGKMTMQQIPSLELPPNQPVELKPGSYHLMLIHLKHPLAAGDKVTVTLHFEKAGTRTVTADVRAL
jgi:copper(I)-binding protein